MRRLDHSSSIVVMPAARPGLRGQRARLSAWLLALAAGAGCQTIERIPPPPVVDRMIFEPVPRAGPPVEPIGRNGWATIGRSIRGRTIDAATLGQGPMRVYVIGGMHGDRPAGPAVAADLPSLLAGDPILDLATIRIVRDINPDGTGVGVRTNTRGVDLDRNWPGGTFSRASGQTGTRALSELETAAVDRDLKDFKPQIVIVLRGASQASRSSPSAVVGDPERDVSQQLDNAAGPGVAFAGSAAVLASRFAGGARRHEPRFRVLPAAGVPQPGSLAAYLTLTHRLPVLRVDLPTGAEPGVDLRATAAGLGEMVGVKPAAATKDDPPYAADAAGGR